MISEDLTRAKKKEKKKKEKKKKKKKKKKKEHRSLEEYVGCGISVEHVGCRVAISFLFLTQRTFWKSAKSQ